MSRLAIPMGLVAAALLQPAAFACDCPRYKDPVKQAEREAAQRDRLVAVKVLDFRLEQNSKYGLLGTALVKVVKQPSKGRFPQTFRVVSMGGNEGGNCGGASLLFEAMSKDARLSASLSPVDAKGSSWLTTGCEIAEVGEWESAYSAN
ncbi:MULTISPECIES: hypothetical protein [unclassified Beijerinckia]|uniref:hypothetical protein n=1 Tax=unclassified Beijerinckia TaxID=2638183 RepID=UPI0008961A53|nr:MULTISPECIES: hypothetical protein [unclassified Beijerinckia]MDH7795781.1 hypothetical protein [Beijerinckia sp. GAS462]SEC15963.1 hypothetical protein SAMN05443249_2058 [Beijerinckia sp. 28-YEA-48]